MKLLNLTIFYYLFFTLLTFTLGGIILFSSIKHIVLHETMESLNTEKELIHQQIEYSRRIPDFNSTFNHQIQVILDIKVKKNTEMFKDTTITDSLSKPIECLMMIARGRTHDYRGFQIKIIQPVQEENQQLYDIFSTLVFAFIILLLTLGILNFSILKGLWRSFYLTLNKIRGFDIKSQSEFIPVRTNVKEFREFNIVLKALTEKIKDDYINLKEFSENVSHEIQTPLSVIRSKVEQILQASEITDHIAENLQSIDQSVTKISRVNQALILITKIQNFQFNDTNPVVLNDKLAEIIAMFSDLIHARNINISFEESPPVKLNLNSDLADILFTNLFSNAIKHNIENGWIHVKLSLEKLIIQNSGVQPGLPAKELFRRFIKANPSSDSLGLGLTIIDKIVSLYHMKIDYQISENIHTTTIFF